MEKQEKASPDVYIIDCHYQGKRLTVECDSLENSLASIRNVGNGLVTRVTREHADKLEDNNGGK